MSASDPLENLNPWLTYALAGTVLDTPSPAHTMIFFEGDAVHSLREKNIDSRNCEDIHLNLDVPGKEILLC